MKVNRSVRMRQLACVLLLTLFSAIPLSSKSHPRPPKQEAPADPGYASALSAANHFLHAWQTGDMESGMVQLSDGLRHSQNAEQIEKFFSNAKSRAFEITRGHGHPGRYSFPVVLVSAPGSHLTRKFSEIVVVDAGKNDWVVDKLP